MTSASVPARTPRGGGPGTQLCAIAGLVGLLCCCGLGTGVSSDDSRPAPLLADGGVAAREQPVPQPRPIVGVVVIDVQVLFVNTAANNDIAQILEGAKEVSLLARDHQAPFLITFEHSKVQSGYTLPPQLQGAVPPDAHEFVKTTFAATGLPSFASRVRQLGLSHLLLLGAETDVCVLQTALGLRAMDLTVILLEDTVFTSEPNTAPALRRMKQAGVLMARRAQVQNYLGRSSALPPRPELPVRIVEPLGVAAVLNHLDDAALASSADPRRLAKQARLRELLLISEWFDIPLYGTTTTLPAALKGLVSKPVMPLASLATNAAVKQVVLAGTDQDLIARVNGLRPTHDVFIMEDGLLATGAIDQATALEGLYQSGVAVPTTYKSFYYEMTRSIDLQQWPKAWVERYDEYYNKTSAPEDLPPIS